MRISLFVFICLFFLVSFTSKIDVDAIYFNGNVFTIDNQFSNCEAFVIKDGKFLATGSTENILAKYDSKLKVDLHQKYVYPGLIDAHCHFYGYAGDLYKLQLVGTKSFEEVLSKVVQYEKEKDRDFIYGRGWDQNDWVNKEFPTNEKLNKLFPNKPVFLKRIDGHAVLVNEKFLKLAENLLKPFENSIYIEIKNGKSTGILFDNAMDAVESLIPLLSVEMMTEEIVKAQKECFQLGITSLADAGLTPNQIYFIDSLQKAGTLKLRIYAMISATRENLEVFNQNGKIKTPYLNVRSVKVYADGALGSRGAKLKKEYSDKHNHTGALNTTMAEFEEYARWAIGHQYQLNTHAIGDSAIALILNLYSKYLPGKNDLRWRIEHAQVVDKTDIDFFSKYAIIPSVQPTHATSDMYWAKDRLGENRMAGAYAYKTLLNQNGWLPLGTDFPVEYLNPQYTFYAAVSRRDANNYPANGFNSNEGLSREEALKGITIWAAKANFEEVEKGSIEIGKYADFIIYDLNFMKDDLLKIRNSKPLKTFVNGIEVSHN